MIDNKTVTLCSIKSIPRAFCLPNNCSAPPLIAPDNPALLPDCNNTTVINDIEVMINRMIKIVFICVIPPTFTNSDIIAIYNAVINK